MSSPDESREGRPKPSINYDKTEMIESRIMRMFIGCGVLTIWTLLIVISIIMIGR